MDHSNNGRTQNKIVPFPNLPELLLKKGMNAMSDKKFEDAIAFFGQAYDLEPDNEEINMGLALTYIEMGNYIDAKDLVKKMLGSGIGDYFHIVNIYLMILLQLNEHEELITTIEGLLEDEQIPIERIESLENLLSLSKRMVEQNGNVDSVMSSPAPMEEEDGREILQNGAIEEQLLFLTSLADQNIRLWLGLLKEYLTEENHPFLKTIVLNLFVEQEVSEIVSVRKFGEVWEVDTGALPILDQTPFLKGIERILSRMLEHDNPIMYEQAMEMVKRHNILLYPKQMTNLANWAEAYYYLILEAYDTKHEEPEESVLEIMNDIRELEGIAFPLI